MLSLSQALVQGRPNTGIEESTRVETTTGTTENTGTTESTGPEYCLPGHETKIENGTKRCEPCAVSF